MAPFFRLERFPAQGQAQSKDKGGDMEKVTRRDFLRFGTTSMAGVAAVANFPILGKLALADLDSDFLPWP
jgi:hypothetical protein